MPSRAEILEKVYDYCKQDIRTELALHRRLRGLGSQERKVWLLDQKINERGVRLDMEYVSAAQTVCDLSAKPLLEKFSELTGGLKASQRDKFLQWLQAKGSTLPNLKKETLDKVLGDDETEDDTLADTDEDYEPQEKIILPEVCREPLRIRRILSSASIKKLAAMPLCCASDGRAHGLLQYHGAGPGRWSGRLLQPQNFPRPSLRVSRGFGSNGVEIFEGHEPEQLVASILTRDAEYVRALFGEPIQAVASGLRHALIAAPGHTFEVGDFSTIEARIVLALAGARQALAVITDKDRNVYAETACKVFPLEAPRGKENIKAWKEAYLFEYTIGKNIFLGCGFQMGKRKFKSRYAQNKSEEFAEKCVNTYRQDIAPEVPKLWEALGQAATRTVWDRRSHEAYGIVYRMEDGFLTAHLPSDRKLWYYDPQPVRKAMPWDATDIRPAFEYSAWKMGQWKRISGYGGLMAENVAQALARDLLVNGMYNAEANDHKVVLTVHDEIVVEVEESNADADLIRQFMEEVPSWAEQLKIPVAAETWIGARYRK